MSRPIDVASWRCRRCGQPVPRPATRIGRPSVFCSPSCRQANYRGRRSSAEARRRRIGAHAGAGKSGEQFAVPSVTKCRAPIDLVGHCWFRWPCSARAPLDRVLLRSIIDTEIGATMFAPAPPIALAAPSSGVTSPTFFCSASTCASRNFGSGQKASAAADQRNG